MNWKSPDQSALPDFILGGAMKCGTTTLRCILNQHPDVFLPENEIHFFDIDNILQHPDFNFFNKANRTWQYQNMDSNDQKLWNWYTKHFIGGTSKFIGEVSTTYLASPKVAQRIAMQDKPIKLLFSLRHPTERAYSNYWHLVKTGRTSYTFEDQIKYHPEAVLNRSLYCEQLSFYYDALDRDRIHVICFEQMTANTNKVIQEICVFLKIAFDKLPKEALSIHAHRTETRRFRKLQLVSNKLTRAIAFLQYKDSLPVKPKNPSNSWLSRAVRKTHHLINPGANQALPDMNPSTKEFLDSYFYKQLDGINKLVGFNIIDEWFPS